MFAYNCKRNIIRAKTKFAQHKKRTSVLLDLGSVEKPSHSLLEEVFAVRLEEEQGV